MEVTIVNKQGRWVIMHNDTPVSNYKTKPEALKAAEKLARQKKVGKLTWADYKKDNKISSKIFK